MSPCDDIAADAAGLAALPAGAPERARAEAHAATCPACARALADGLRLMRALDAAPPPLVSPDALARAAEPILRELDAAAAGARAATAGRARGLRPWVAAAAAAVTWWVLPLALMRRPMSGRGLLLSLGLGTLAAFTSAMTVASAGVVAGAFPVLSAVFSLLAGSGGDFHAHVGVHCALVELLGALGASAMVGVATLRRAPRDASLTIAAAGGGALAAQAALHARCSAGTELPHLLVFHTGAVMLALVAALAAAQVAEARRGRARAE